MTKIIDKDIGKDNLTKTIDKDKDKETIGFIRQVILFVKSCNIQHGIVESEYKSLIKIVSNDRHGEPGLPVEFARQVGKSLEPVTW